MVMTVTLLAQTTLTFVGRDRTGNDYVRLSSVSVYDLDQLWHQIIEYPDTTLVLYVNGTVGVETMYTSSLQMQNNPNPFDGATDVILCTPYADDVTMEIADVNGHIVGTHSVRPQPGTHQFRITLSAPGTYVLTARQNGRTVSVKMVNAGNGGGDGIEYMGFVETPYYDVSTILTPKSNTRGDGHYPFHNWDRMRYTGYAVVDDVEIESETVEKAQNGSETIPLKFDVARPEVVTNAASNIAATAAMLHGEVTADNNALVTERGFCYGTAPSPTYSSSPRVEAGNGLGAFSATINGLTAGTTYYTRAYAKNAVGVSYGANKSFHTNDTLPVVTTAEPSNISATTFTSGGEVLTANGAAVTVRGICWNTTGAPIVSDSHTSNGIGLGAFTSNATGLSCSTTYYVRAYATNSVGTAYGEEYSVTTTQELAFVTTESVSSITDNSAVCSGEVPYDGCSEVTARGVCWSTEQNPTIADNHTTDGSGLGDFTSNLTELAYVTTYYVRAYATNGVGTAYGNEVSFTTNPILPTVTTMETTDVTATTFTCGGDVTNDGGAEVTARGICWSTEQNPTITDSYTTDGSGLGTFTSNVNGLTCGTTYYVRAYATNSVGTAYGEEISVTTTQELAFVTTNNVSDITDNSAVCGGNVNYDGCSEVTARGVCWSIIQNPTLADDHTADGNGMGSFTSNITGLNYVTTYYVRAYATNSVGIIYGEEVSFTTPPALPVVATASATDITATTFACGGNVTNDGGAEVTARGICWSTNPNPTIADSHTTQTGGLGSFTSDVTGLDCGTTYYVRAYATNSVGTAYGEEISVTTTQELAFVTTNNVSDITDNSAVCGGNVNYDGCSEVTARGVCWSIIQNPTLADDHTADGNGMGSFTSNITGLNYVTTYYVRAYATNSVGTIYGEEVSFTTPPALPVVTTASTADITATTFACGGNVTNDGGAEVTARGICWSTEQNPTIADNHTTDGSGLGFFTSNVTGLFCGTTYYVRAYATNSVGTAYGEEYSVTTLPPTVPDVVLSSANIYNGLSIAIQAEVINENCSAVTERGICWGLAPSPTIINDYHTSNGNGMGIFSDTLTGLETATTYYIRAYATNEFGTSYSEEESITMPDYPTVTTSSVTDIASTIATSGGTVTSDGGTIVTARGVCWSTIPNPTIADSHTTDGTGTGSFTSSVTGLTAVTTYYVRAYATNNVGTSYGDELTFTTLETPCGEFTLTDIDGNTYNTVQIGTQCWMKENLRTTKYADGTSISQGSSTSSTTAYWYYPNNDASNKTTYGLLYNWTAVMRNSSSSSANPSGVQGVCPTGWHVPSDAEWKQMEIAVGMTPIEADNLQQWRGSIAKSLSGTTGWASSSSLNVPGNISGNNSSGFSALPAGNYYYGSYLDFGDGANFWSATEDDSSNAWQRILSYRYAGVGRYYGNKGNGCSVRCLRDEGGSTTSQFPTITTSSVTDITSTTATSGGSITSDGGATVTARGVCWNTTGAPSVADSHTTDGNGTGSFTSSLTGLTANTTYYVRAYATNSVGTGYGDEVSFTTNSTASFTCGTSTLTDIDGNTYNTVQIGTQCWMKENLRTTKYADGTSISQGSSTSSTTAYWYYPNNDASNKTTYGLLYNWKAVMRNSSSSSANPSGEQGICPTGWHVPSDAEWKQMEMAVGMSQSYADGTGYRGTIAAKLSGNTGWTSSTNANAAGNLSAPGRNSSGFSALPAGAYGGIYLVFGNGAFFWSATEGDSDNAWRRDLNYSYAGVNRLNYDKVNGYSVRCLRDEGGSTTSQFPTITTSSVTDITSTTATSGGSITSDGGATVTARGVCWNTTGAPSVADSHTTDGNGTGSFTSSLTGLTANTTYYVRAYATNSVGTGYGDEVSFTTNSTASFTCGTSTLTDIDGNTYNTVQIGNQCWMKENLRTTKYADGTSISQGSSISNPTAYWYYPDNDASNKTTYGLLYNWKAVMRNSSSSSANPSGVQGVCPTGWHVPSDAEFTQLTDYVSSQSQYVCGSSNAYIAKALAGATGWSSSTGTCCVGNTPSQNNSTGFSALPAGGYSSISLNFGDFAYFWSATENSSSDAYSCVLTFLYAYVNRDCYYKIIGYSVRCLRD